MKQVVEYTRIKFIKILDAHNKYDAIRELAGVFHETSVCSDIDDLTSALSEREDIMSTGIGFGIAIPHAKISSIKKIAFAIGISKTGIDFDSMDGEPVHLIILVAAGERQHKEYLKILSRIMMILKKSGIKEQIINTNSPEEIIEIFRSHE